MAAPKKQREYPRVSNIKDQDIKETIKLLWDRTHEGADLNAQLRTLIESAQATIAAQSTTISDLQKQMKIVSAGAGTSQRSTVGGGGSGGTSGGSGSPPPPTPGNHPNHYGDVVQAIADLVAASVDLSGACGSFQVIKLVTWRLKDTEPNIGLIAKGGTNCDGYSIDAVLYKDDGATYDCLQDADNAPSTGATPTWNSTYPADINQWRPPIPPAI